MMSNQGFWEGAMRKLTILLLSGVFLAVTGGASVARGEDFAILLCVANEDSFVVRKADTSFTRPAPACDGGSSCSQCVDAITEEGLKLVATSVNFATPTAATTENLANFGVGNFIEFVFAEKIAGD